MHGAGSDAYYEVEEIVDNPWRYVVVKIEPKAGGGGQDRKPDRPIKLTNYDVVIKQRRVRQNNCGPLCIIDLLGLNITPLQMRKDCVIEVDRRGDAHDV